MLAKVKQALRIKTEAYNDELNGLISAALLDLGVTDISAEVLTTNADMLVTQAVITYCKMHFGNVAQNDYYKFKKSYDEQKAQLSTCTGYTIWIGDDE